MAFSIRVIRAEFYNSYTQKMKLYTSLKYWEMAFNSLEFNDAILNHYGFHHTGQTNLQVLYKLLGGQELGTVKDFKADLRLTLKNSNSYNNVGYTLYTTIITFRNQFENLKPEFLAGHYVHEYCHTIGYADPNNIADIRFNVPYEVGRIVTDIATRKT